MHFAEMHRKGAICGRKQWQTLEKGLQTAGRSPGHHRRDDRLCAAHVIVHGQDERARAPCPTVLLEDQRVELLQCQITLAGYAERQGVTPDSLVIGGIAQRDTIVALRPILFADQVIGQPAIRGIIARLEPERLGLREIAERLARSLGADQDRGHAGLHPAVARIDLLGAREQCRGTAQITEPDRQIPRADQCIDVAGVRRELPHRVAETIRVGRSGQGLDDFLRPRAARCGD